MSESEEETYSTMFSSLRHPARRKILRMLSEKSMTFSEILDHLGIPSSHLTYHLENLGELVVKKEDGKYKLSSFGEAAVVMMKGAEEAPAVQKKSFSSLPLSSPASEIAVSREVQRFDRLQPAEVLQPVVIHRGVAQYQRGHFLQARKVLQLAAGNLAVADVQRLEIGEVAQLGQDSVANGLIAEDAGPTEIDARHPLVECWSN